MSVPALRQPGPFAPTSPLIRAPRLHQNALGIDWFHDGVGLVHEIPLQPAGSLTAEVRGHPPIPPDYGYYPTAPSVLDNFRQLLDFGAIMTTAMWYSPLTLPLISIKATSQDEGDWRNI